MAVGSIQQEHAPSRSTHGAPDQRLLHLPHWTTPQRPTALFIEECGAAHDLKWPLLGRLNGDTASDAIASFISMAEVIGLASGVLTLSIFAFQSGTALLQTIDSFKSHQTRVQDLSRELEALCGVLDSLRQTSEATTDLDLSSLHLPLLQCGKACDGFRAVLLRCSARSRTDKTSFRDWAKLVYMGDSIDGFRQQLSGYKSTIIIALTNMSLRKSSTAVEDLAGYKDLLQTATADLQAHLEAMDDKIEALLSTKTRDTSGTVSELQQLRQEQKSTVQCLQICSQLAEHIAQIEQDRRGGGGPSGSQGSGSASDRMTSQTLRDCKKSLAETMTKLEAHMNETIGQILAKSKSKSNITPDEDAAELARLQDGWNAARQCVNICQKAEIQLRESVSNIDNYATGDAVQFMVSTNGQVLHGRNRGLGWRTRQVGGHLDDATVQKLSGDFAGMNVARSGSARQYQVDDMEDKTELTFDKYGHGFRLDEGDIENSVGSRSDKQQGGAAGRGSGL